MVIYIEYLIIDNIVMDYLIFYLMKLTFKFSYSKIRLISALMLGVVSAFFLPYLISYAFILFVYRIVFSIVIILTLVKFKTLKKFILHVGAFWLYTFLMGGAILGILNLLNINYNVSSVILYNCQVPMGAILILCVANIWLIKNIVVAISEQIRMSKFLYKIKLIDGKSEVVALGFLDSGNKVEVDGKGVNIISLNIFEKLHKDIGIEKLILGKVDKDSLKNMAYINIASLESECKYLTFTIDKMMIEKNTFENVNVAVALKNFDDFDCILSSEFVGGGI